MSSSHHHDYYYCMCIYIYMYICNYLEPRSWSLLTFLLGRCVASVALRSHLQRGLSWIRIEWYVLGCTTRECVFDLRVNVASCESACECLCAWLCVCRGVCIDHAQVMRALRRREIRARPPGRRPPASRRRPMAQPRPRTLSRSPGFPEDAIRRDF